MENLLDLYTDYLLTTPTQATCTGLSKVLHGQISHDRFTRLLLSGIPGQWMAHQIDTVHWFSGYPHPRSVAANGGGSSLKKAKTKEKDKEPTKC